MTISSTALRRFVAVFVILFSVAVVAYVARALGSNGSDTETSHVINFSAQGRPVARVNTEAFDLQAAGERARFRRVVMNRVPQTISIRRAGVRRTFRLSRREAASAALLLGDRGGNVSVATSPSAVRIAAPSIKQKLRNNCEATALQILLRTTGRGASQLRLQAELTRSGPLDPVGTGSNRTWGDPDLGFVGRPDGGGTAGGFGVYPGPVKQLAAKRGVALRDLTGEPARRIYTTLLAGNAVMVWVGLGDGPYSSWRSPSGRSINVNLNEHTVVLNGLDRSGRLTVVNPLNGRTERWSKQKFETMWELLGRRALAA